MKAKEIMSSPPDILTDDTPLQVAADEMQKHDFGFLPVRHNGEVTGVVTDRDMIIRAFAKGLDPKQTKLKDIMTKEVIWCHEDDNIEEVANLMSQKQISRIAVYNDKKKLTGIVSVGDIARECRDVKLCGEISEAIHKEK